MKEKVTTTLRAIARFFLYCICIPTGAISAICMLALDALEE